MELLQGGYHESYSTGSMVGKKQKENWEIIYIYIYFMLSVHFYIEEL